MNLPWSLQFFLSEPAENVDRHDSGRSGWGGCRGTRPRVTWSPAPDTARAGGRVRRPGRPARATRPGARVGEGERVAEPPGQHLSRNRLPSAPSGPALRDAHTRPASPRTHTHIPPHTHTQAQAPRPRTHARARTSARA